MGHLFKKKKKKDTCHFSGKPWETVLKQSITSVKLAKVVGSLFDPFSNFQFINEKTG